MTCTMGLNVVLDWADALLTGTRVPGTWTLAISSSELVPWRRHFAGPVSLGDCGLEWSDVAGVYPPIPAQG
jgi:hypothetical protein